MQRLWIIVSGTAVSSEIKKGHFPAVLQDFLWYSSVLQPVSEGRILH